MKKLFPVFLSFLVLSSISAHAESDPNSGQYALEKGLQYFHGEGVERDFNEAAKYIVHAAELGNIDAYLNLGFLYDLGIGIEQNYLKAAKYYELAAKSGDATAQYNLGILYNFGRGVEIDYQTAALWYEKAAQQGYIDAQYNLGVLYEEGRGVPKNPIIADKWYILAAASDHAAATTRHEALVVKLKPEELQKAWESAYEWGVTNVAFADENA